jgi:hypothetical protein
MNEKECYLPAIVAVLADNTFIAIPRFSQLFSVLEPTTM